MEGYSYEEQIAAEPARLVGRQRNEAQQFAEDERRADDAERDRLKGWIYDTAVAMVADFPADDWQRFALRLRQAFDAEFPDAIPPGEIRDDFFRFDLGLDDIAKALVKRRNDAKFAAEQAKTRPPTARFYPAMRRWYESGRCPILKLDRDVFHWLVDHADATTGRGHPSHARLARLVGSSEAYIADAINRLKALGAIRLVRAGGGGKVNVYQVVIPKEFWQ